VLLLIIIFSTHSNFVCPGANKFGYRRNSRELFDFPQAWLPDFRSGVTWPP
jgi:hypothetical protein